MPSLDDKYKYYIQKHKTITKNCKNKAKTLCLGLRLMRILFRVNPGLGFNSFSLGHHISNSKGVLGGIGISRRLNSFTLCFLFWPRDPHITLFFFFLNPCWDLNPLRRVLGDERLLGRRKGKGKGYKRRKSSWFLSDIFYMQKETSTIEVLMELQQRAQHIH